MASLGQLEHWLKQAHERVEKYRDLLDEETRKKKELLRPKSPAQIKEKEVVIAKIQRYRDELEHSKKRRKDLELQLRGQKKSETSAAPRSAKSLGRVLSKKFNSKPTKAVSESKEKQAASAANNKIDLPEGRLRKGSSGNKEMDFLQEILGKLHGLEEKIQRLEQKSDDRHGALREKLDQLFVLR